MILAILISVSLAPGSYFFWAFAAGAASKTAVAIVKPAKCIARGCIILSLMMFWGDCRSRTAADQAVRIFVVSRFDFDRPSVLTALAELRQRRVDHLCKMARFGGLP